MMLEALAERLQSASVAFPAQDLFIGLMPDKPDRCVAIYEYAGAQPLEVLVNNSATLERPSVQVLVRAARNDYPSAKALISSVRNSLTGITNETISGERFLRVNQISSINALGVDDNERPRFTLSLQVVMER
jgi:hypothetical protein